MTISARDRALIRVRAKEKRIEVALKAIAALTDDEADFVYAKLEKRVIGGGAHTQTQDEPERETETTPPRVPKAALMKARAKGTRACSFCHKPGHNVQTCEAKKASEMGAETPKRRTAKTRPGPKPGSLAGKPNYAALAREVLAANPQGLRAYEIAKKIGQTKVSNAFGTLKLLERLGYAERHGERYSALWTVPGITPKPRIETVGAAVVHVLITAGGAVDGWKLRDEVVKMIVAATGKRPRLASVTTEISRLMAKGVITTDGANEHGPLYIAVEKGGSEARALN
jgi:hypothetical protein